VCFFVCLTCFFVSRCLCVFTGDYFGFLGVFVCPTCAFFVSRRLCVCVYPGATAGFPCVCVCAFFDVLVCVFV
jgi:hypothetical protein